MEHQTPHGTNWGIMTIQRQSRQAAQPVHQFRPGFPKCPRPYNYQKHPGRPEKRKASNGENKDAERNMTDNATLEGEPVEVDPR